SYNVLRTRIDRFGVVAPNIQRLEKDGRILVELPGIKEPERVRKLLQGSANLEFWETYRLGEIFNKLQAANNALALIEASSETNATDTAAVIAVEETVVAETANTDTTKAMADLKNKLADNADQKSKDLMRKQIRFFFSTSSMFRSRSCCRYSAPQRYSGNKPSFSMKQVREILTILFSVGP
ncbi:MAG: protein translocase subunit SecDF, partial [Barnesiella sp.]